MKIRYKKSALMVLLAIGALPVSVLATNGYVSHGWGTASKAMGGVATALPRDSLVAATNPAGMAFIGNRMDLGVAFFNPSPRGYEANADYPGAPGQPTGPFVTPGRYESDKDWFVVPSLGYNRVLDDKNSIGVSIFGNGGMNTEYNDRPVWEGFVPPDPAQNPGGIFTATTPTGINLEQLFIEVPWAYKIGEGQAIGIAPVFAVQRLEVQGLQPFRGASVSPYDVSNNGNDWSYGLGLHLGWMGRINDKIDVGISYRSKTYMSEFSDYKGLLADGGNFDIPAIFNAGLAYKIQPNLVLGVDYQHIFYSEVDALSNSNDVDLSPCFTPGAKPTFCLGGKNGLGFGWDSMDVLKIGAEWKYDPTFTFRAGFSVASDFTDGNQALFNVMAPATTKYHYTLGGTYNINDRNAINLSYAYMPEEELKGRSPNITQSQSGSIFMEQQEIELSWSFRF